MNKSVKEKVKKAYDIAYKYEGDWGSCSQCTIRALQEIYDEINDNIFQALGSFAAGGGCEGDGICGAYAAGLFFFGTRFGRRFEDIGKNPNDPKALEKHVDQFSLVKKLHDKFVDKYGNVICNNIQRKLYGRPFYIADPEELEKLDKAGGHDWGCTGVSGDAAKWSVEILEEFLYKKNK